MNSLGYYEENGIGILAIYTIDFIWAPFTIYDLELIFTSFWPFWQILAILGSGPLEIKYPLTGQNDLETVKIALVDIKNIFCLHPSSMILHQGALQYALYEPSVALKVSLYNCCLSAIAKVGMFCWFIYKIYIFLGNT